MKLSKERYENIKEMSNQCIMGISENPKQIPAVIDAYTNSLNNKEEIILFTISILMPNDEVFINLYDECNHNVVKVAKILNVPVNYVITKVYELTVYNKMLSQEKSY